MKRSIVLVDGGFLRSQTNEARHTYDVPFIEKFSRSCLAKDEECLRISVMLSGSSGVAETMMDCESGSIAGKAAATIRLRARPLCRPSLHIFAKGLDRF